ncbi:unnamed protein product [Blepharisma stoltei]|uniref:RING-type domain-containing protein n=1 Tax=Blepharisma stoltei TaxID=1481888 RepID=A0AAU9JVD9_9CILI|nr:unnamed protein product [Blepharisma stoltei]
MLKKLFDFISCKRPRSEDSSKAPIKKRKPYIFCAICNDVISLSSTLRCGHSFCEPCIAQYLLYSAECPKCDRFVRNANLYPSFSFDQIIEEEIGKTDLEKWKNRRNEVEINKKSKRLRRAEIGMKIDVRDLEGIWCVGIIKCAIKGNNNPAIYVHFEGWDNCFDELIPLDSERIAPLGLYTNKNIPKYVLPKRDGNKQADLVYYKQ